MTRSFSSEAENTHKEARQDGLKPESCQCGARYHPPHGFPVLEATEVVQPPLVDSREQQDQAHRQGTESRDQSALEVDNREKSAEPRVVRDQPFGNGKRLRKNRKEDRLVAAQNGQTREKKSMCVEGDISDGDAGQGECISR